VAEAVTRREALAVVAYCDLQLVGPVVEAHIHPAGVRVLECVGQAFLHDSIGGEVDRAREREGVAVDVQPDWKPGAAHLFQQRVEPVDTRMGREFEAIAVAAHRPEQAAHLGKGSAAGLLDASKGIPVLREHIRELVPNGADLEHHDADGVSDDVVELARDPRPLLGDRDARRCLPLLLGLGRAYFGRLGLLGPLAQRVAR
jgi:hypothetical protein